jgi:hypothetical protein
MKNHIIVFLAYKNFDIVRCSFKSIENANADFFIIENQSENSDKIQQYFSTKNIVGHIRFNENIANSAYTEFIKHYIELLRAYKYITFTDGDLFVYDTTTLFMEIFKAFDNPECVISSADLWMGNDYRKKERLNIDYYISYMNVNPRVFGSIEGNTGGFFLTIQNKDLDFLCNNPFLDSDINRRVVESNRKWFKTNRNVVYHLTWDLYVDGNEYYEWKKEVAESIWFENKFSTFTVIK